MEGIDRFHWNLARSFQGVSSVFAFIGIISNAFIFLTTIRTRSLRATYNILIAVCALADVFHLFGTLVQLPFLMDYFIELDSAICAALMFLPEMGIGIGCTCILCVGLDRMLSVLYSLRYRSLNGSYYHFFLGSLITLYCAYLCVLMVVFYGNRPLYCEIMAPFGAGTSWFVIANLTVNVISSIVYFFIWIGLQSHADSKAMKRIIKSLLIIVCVDVSGWLLTPGLIALSQRLDIDPQQKFAMIYFSIIFINLALSVKLPIYYFTRLDIMFRNLMNAIFSALNIELQ
ncbi:hypothetical protein PMAYCL1PPCAC_26763 [Pristionchus mayeri]|uniref:G-protein coupled receptors family 1 profile domain-containing protein n=1 Tax=Pristionchus mayeri TaxID=1317129 RepID=A0AAN5D4P7_9BILA|nr:hypothetical protein PMAYCL1PPCAC_26763 [Pristionchus mayeri]